MGRTSSMRIQSQVEIGGRTATGDDQTMRFFVCPFVCMFVTLDVQERGPDVQQRIMSLFVEEFQCGFYCFSQKNELSNRLQRFQLYRQVAPQCSTESAKILKNFQKLTEKFVNTTSTIQGQHIIKVSSGLCRYGIIDVHLYHFFQIAVYLKTPKILKSAQVLLKVDDGRKFVRTGNSLKLSLLNKF